MTATSIFAFAVYISLPAAVLVLWQKVCKSRPIWMQSLDKIGLPRESKLRGTGVVCGGSIAGIVTARILADHFQQVILVDPEFGSDEPKTRIMQYHAIHVFPSLFVTGARRLWPNFDASLRAIGGRFVPADLQMHYSGLLLLTPYQDYPSGCFPETLVMRRSTAQTTLEKILLDHPTAANITLVSGTVRSIQRSHDRNAVESVLVRQLDGTQMTLSNVALVADCTGSTQVGLKWLENAGISLPKNIRASYNGNLNYTTICFSVPPELEETLPVPETLMNTVTLYAFMSHVDLGNPGLGLLKTDNDTMQLLLVAGGVELPRVASDIVPFITEMQGHAPIPSWFIETVTILCELGKPSFGTFKIPSQSYIQYHSLPPGRLPSNFVSVGDAIMQLNPVHGQGFAQVMMNGITLNALLHTVGIAGLPDDFSARYFQSNARDCKSLWDGTRLHDYGSSACEPVEGETKNTGRLLRWFELKMISAATRDVEVASALWHLRQVLAADRVLLAPKILWKILRTPSLF